MRPRENRVAGLGSFLQLSPRAGLEPRADPLRQSSFNSVPRDDPQAVPESRRIGDGGSRADGREIVSDDIRNDEREDVGRCRSLREASALHAREMFSNRVELADVGSAPKEKLRRPDLVVESDSRSRSDQEGRGPAGEKKEDSIRSSKIRELRENPSGRAKTRFIRKGMPAFFEGQSLERHAVPVLHDDSAGILPALKNAFER